MTLCLSCSGVNATVKAIYVRNLQILTFSSFFSIYRIDQGWENVVVFREMEVVIGELHTCMKD